MSAESEKPQKPAEESASPFEPGSCLCGVPNCAGHEEIDGKITFKGHPTIPDGEVELVRTPPASGVAKK